MRTSGAPAERALTYIPIVVAIVILVLVLGGPLEFLKAAESVVRGVAAFLMDWAEALRRAF